MRLFPNSSHHHMFLSFPREKLRWCLPPFSFSPSCCNTATEQQHTHHPDKKRGKKLVSIMMDPYNNPSPPSKFHEETLLTGGGGLLGRKSNLGRGGKRRGGMKNFVFPPHFRTAWQGGGATTLKQGLLSFPWHDKTRRELARLEFPSGDLEFILF